ALPAEGTPYMEGMKLSAVICFCLLPMAAWLVTIFCMTRYSLSGEKMREVQAVNAVRKAAVQRGMSMEQAMETWQTIDQVPERFVQQVDKKDEKQSFLDRVYEKYFTITEKTGGVPSSQAIEIPD
ncbi:MAG: hypothetical protein IJK35_10355, partial [Oscillospiraceae bacterium]|nr:hypothetical protein [Oscillospiraceae bacterium]